MLNCKLSDGVPKRSLHIAPRYASYFADAAQLVNAQHSGRVYDCRPELIKCSL